MISFRMAISGIALLLCCCTTGAFAQKGLPAPEKTNASVNTAYPQQQDFNDSLLTRLKVPEGFTLVVAARGLGKPRMMAIHNNALYVTRRDVGDVLMLQDKDGDGKFDQAKTIVAHYDDVHGITIHNGWLYLCSSKKLSRGRLNDDGTVGKLDTLINDLPEGGQHDNRTIAFGPDNKLYITVGSDCNDCAETNPEQATIVQTNEDGSGRKVYARGLRNTIGFDWHPETHELWGMDHGTDWRGDEKPPEELNRIVEKGDYGWPQVYGKQSIDSTREDPVGTTKAEYAKTTVPAVMLFPAHSAPIDFRFLTKPAAYRNQAIVTWHGSWNRKQPEGYKVQLIEFRNGQPVGARDFLSGFLSPDGRQTFARPAGLAIAEDGSIFISDDAGGIIYKLAVSK